MDTSSLKLDSIEPAAISNLDPIVKVETSSSSIYSEIGSETINDDNIALADINKSESQETSTTTTTTNTDPEDSHDESKNKCSWQRTAGLLLSEYICLAILSFPYTYSVLGVIPGVIITIVIGLLSFYTGTVVGDYCIAHPHLRDVCDIGRHIFWGKSWAYYGSMVCFLMSTLFVQGMHVLVGAAYLDTVTDQAYCTVTLSVIAAVGCLVLALPRSLSQLSYIGLFSALTQFVAVVLCVVFICIQDHPANYDANSPVSWSLWPKKDISFEDVMNSIMNIVFMFTGHSCYPQFISEMKKPKDFRKALLVLVILQLVIYITPGIIILVLVGDNYITSLAFGSLVSNGQKILSFSFSVPTIVFLGSLFGNIGSQFVFVRLFKGDDNKEHREGSTTKGWTCWVLISLGTWVIGFVIAELVPFFSELLSLMSALFEGWFSFVFWGVAFLRLKQQKYNTISLRQMWSQMDKGEKWLSSLNVLVVIAGLFFFGPGTYASVMSIKNEFEKGNVGGVFSCDSVSL